MAEVNHDATPLVEAPGEMNTTAKIAKTGEGKKKKEKSIDRKVRRIKPIKSPETDRQTEN